MGYYNAITRVPEGCLPSNLQRVYQNKHHFKAVIITVGYKYHNLPLGGSTITLRPLSASRTLKHVHAKVLNSFQYSCKSIILSAGIWHKTTYHLDRRDKGKGELR